MPYSSSAGQKVAMTTSSIEDRQASTGADLLLSLAETATAAAWGNTKRCGSDGSVTPSPVSSSLEEKKVSKKGVNSSSANTRSSPVTVSSGGTAVPVPSHLKSVDAQASKKRVGSLSGIEQIVAASVKRARAERIVTNDEEESREEKSSSEQARDSTCAEKKDGSSNDQQKGSRQPIISPSSSDEAQQTSAQGEGNKTAQVNGYDAGTCRQPPFYPSQSYYPNQHHGFGRPMHYMQPTPYGYPVYGYAPPLPYYGLIHARPQPPVTSASLHSSGQPAPRVAASPSPRVAASTTTTTTATTAAAAAPPPPKTTTATTTNKQPSKYQATLRKDHTDLKKSSTGDTTSISNRCVPLEHPLPTRSWGQGNDNAQSVTLPDFCQLVNFPEYLARARGGGGGDSKNPGTATAAASAATTEGKKHCVMCGKLRVCSANSLAGRSRTVKDTDEGGNLHIIPRQNKGVCTACDVTVWAVRDRDDLEIKWCKGCKNFRPWAAFGEKGMATKCVRCRTRQKEKYAAAKVGAMKRGKQ